MNRNKLLALAITGLVAIAVYLTLLLPFFMVAEMSL